MYYSYVTITYLLFLWYYKQRLILSNDIEINPGPMFDFSQNLTNVIRSCTVLQRIIFQK